MRPGRKQSILVVAVLAALLSACGASRPIWQDLAIIKRPMVYQVGEGAVRVRWPPSFGLGGVSVYAGTAPDRIDRSEPVAKAWGLNTSVTIENLDPNRRYYFELVPESGAPSRIVAERKLPLEGTDNFRDIGGYETFDGRFVRWGLLYRSNDLASLSEEDIRYLTRLRVQLVCDFRSEPERSRAPDRNPEEAKSLELTIEVDGVDPSAMQERIRTGIRGEELERLMLAAYRSFVTAHSDQWAAMFERIENASNLPTIVHCTAGKDRTGFASAMILLALGVPEETVFEDYMATNFYRANYKKWITRVVPLYSFFRTQGEDMGPLLDARKPYLEASLDTIETEYGSVDAYLEARLGLTADRREQLRQIFLR